MSLRNWFLTQRAMVSVIDSQRRIIKAQGGSIEALKGTVNLYENHFAKRNAADKEMTDEMTAFNRRAEATLAELRQDYLKGQGYSGLIS